MPELQSQKKLDFFRRKDITITFKLSKISEVTLNEIAVITVLQLLLTLNLRYTNADLEISLCVCGVK